MTEKEVYKKGVALLEEWEDVNYCEHNFKFKDEWLTDKEVVELLNELHNKYIDEYTLRETLQLDLQRVEEENKELKAQLYCDDDSVCNICKHQQLIPDKVMQGFYTAKCEKGHKECSKEDLRHCNDFKLKELKE